MSKVDTVQRTCGGCGAVYEIEFWDIANRERNRRTCETPGCDTVILNENCSRDYGPARVVKQPTRARQESKAHQPNLF